MKKALRLGAFSFWGENSASGTAESAVRTRTRVERIDDRELRPNHGNNDKLRETLERLQRVASVAAIPAADQELTLIIRVDEADKVPENDPVLVSEAGTRKDHRGEAGIGDVDRDAGWYELDLSRRQCARRIDASPQVHPRGARGRVCGQMCPNALIEDP